MKNLFHILHEKLGDLWWYSLMLFIACRLGDVIQAFIGLWLVPKYVSVDELGAVMPLQNLSGFFAAPISILATVFAKYVNHYATREDMGKVKSFINDVLTSTVLLFLACIFLAHFLIPHFFERLRIEDGLLTILILSTGFITSTSQILNNALQGLKRFRTIAFINLIGAPIRLITLLVAMPFRALSGYMLGQATPPASSSIVALLRLHIDLKKISSDRTWRHDLPNMIRYAIPIAVWTIGCIAYSTLFTTLIRQRLPETESAAYYMLSRLAEIGGYLGMSVMVVIFPIASEAHEKGKESRNLLKQAMIGSIGFSVLLAFCFLLGGRTLFSSITTWASHLPYVGLLPATTLTVGLSCAISSLITYEMACSRFTPIWIVIGMNSLWICLLIFLMGHEYFTGILPSKLHEVINNFNVKSLTFITWAGLAYTIVQLFAVSVSYLLFSHKKNLS